MKKITSFIKKNSVWLSLCLLVGLGFFLRAFQVGQIPTILNRDEAALAYNGYLLSETGRDEFSRTYPLTLESFGDYKLPGYSYTLAILFKFLPENDFVVRLPSVLAGTILIILSYFFAKNFNFTDKNALAFSGLIALTPIFFFYSRIAFEANVALTFLIASLILLTKSTPNIKTDISATGLMLVAILFYNTPLLLLPFIIIGLTFLRGLKNYKKWLVVNLLLAMLFISMALVLADISSQKSGITIFSDETLWQLSVDHYNSFTGVTQKILGNKYVFFALQMWPRFWNSFSINFLAAEGGSHPWHSLSQHAHIFYLTYVMFFFGLMALIKLVWRKTKKHLLILYLLPVSLVPSIITVDAPHATRSLLFIYLFCFISLYALTTIKKDLWQKILLIIVPIFIIEASLYYDNYFALYKHEQPANLKTGFADLIQEIEEKYPQEPVAIVDDGFQYILTAWYLKTPPQEFLTTIIKQQPDKIGFKYGQQLTHYHFIAALEDQSTQENILLEWRGTHWGLDIRN